MHVPFLKAYADKAISFSRDALENNSHDQAKWSTATHDFAIQDWKVRIYVSGEKVLQK